jgi:hypothetical protein
MQQFKAWVFLYAAEKNGLSELQHQAEDCRLMLCNVLHMSVLDVTSSRTFSDVSLAFADVSPLPFDVSSSFDDWSLTFGDWSVRMSLACPSIFPSNTYRSDSIVLLRRAAVSGSGLVSVRKSNSSWLRRYGLWVVR